MVLGIPVSTSELRCRKGRLEARCHSPNPGSVHDLFPSIRSHAAGPNCTA